MRLLLVGLVGLVTACQSPSGMSGSVNLDECGADGFQKLVGQPDTSIDTHAFPPSTRVIRPDTMVTHDYRPDRLNVYVDAAGNVSEVRCG